MRDDEASKRLLAETVDDILKRPDPFEEMERTSFMELFIASVFLFVIMFTMLITTDILLILTVMVVLMVIGTTYFYVKNMKKLEAVTGKIYLDSTTYLGDASFIEQDEVIGYEMIKNESIGLNDNKFHVIKAFGEKGEQTIYISRVPLDREWFTTQKVVTPYGIADAIGTRITTRIIDVIYDPETEQRIPVKQVLMSPSMTTLDVIELEPVGEDVAKIEPILVDVETDTDVKVQKVDAWAVKCAVCAGNLDIDAINHTDIGTFIECEYCGTNNGLRTLK